MTFPDVVKVCAAIIASLGGGGLIVTQFSGFIGKMWADKELAEQRHKYDVLSRQLQVELDAVSHLRKLRTEDKFQKLRQLWSHIARLRVAFEGLPLHGFVLTYADPAREKETRRFVSQEFLTRLRDAQDFVNQEALSIPKHIGSAAHELLKPAHMEVYYVMVFPESDTVGVPGLEPFAPLPQEFFSERAKRLQEFRQHAERVEDMMREHLEEESQEQRNTTTT